MSVDNTKEIIVNVAERLFGRFGFHKTSMDEIAKIARKAKGSLYYHFASKEDLFREVFLKEINNLKYQLSIIVNNPELNAKEKLTNYFIKRMAILNSAENYHEALKADFFERFYFIDDLRNSLDEWEKEKLEQIILQGVNSGEFILKINVNVLSEISIMILKGLEIPFFLQNKYDKFSFHLEELIRILSKGLSR